MEEKTYVVSVDGETYYMIPSWYLLASGEYLLAQQLILTDQNKRAREEVTGTKERMIHPLILRRGMGEIEDEDDEEEGDFMRAGAGYGSTGFASGDEWKDPDLHDKLESIRNSGVLRYCAEWLPYQHVGQSVNLPREIVISKGFLDKVGTNLYRMASFYYQNISLQAAKSMEDIIGEMKLYQTEEPGTEQKKPAAKQSPSKPKYQIPDMRTRFNLKDGSVNDQFPKIDDVDPDFSIDLDQPPNNN